jgi:hypothetical protein
MTMRMRSKIRLRVGVGAVTALALALAPMGGVLASSHREAPFITEHPKVDGTDFYLFNSYEAGRQDFVTVIADYLPLQDAYGGPNYFTLDPEALYQIHFDNNGDAREDLTFTFQISNDLANGGTGLAVPAGNKMTAVPLRNIGVVSAADTSALNEAETYTVKMTKGNRYFGQSASVTNADTGSKIFKKPLDYVGTKSFGAAPAYANYARAHMYSINIPECSVPGRMFVGQRKEPFAVNLGTIFDLVNAPAAVVVGGNTTAGRNLVPSTIDNKNITTFALELPKSCILGKDGSGKTRDVVAGWTTASARQAWILNAFKPTHKLPVLKVGPFVQLSRLGMPLVNEVVIGLPDKNRFNGSEPRNDGQFADYVTNPSLPELLEILFGAAGVVAPNQFPRADLVAAFLTGVDGVNANGSTAEMTRLNTAIAATPKGMQSDLGAALCFVNGVLTLTNPGCDPAGFPNGRRPGDDVVDIELRVAMGYLLPAAAAPSGQLGFTDAVGQNDGQFDATFPYLTTPNAGAM